MSESTAITAVNVQSASFAPIGRFISPVFNGNAGPFPLFSQVSDSYISSEVNICYSPNNTSAWRAIGLFQDRDGAFQPSINPNSLKAEKIDWRVKYHDDEHVSRMLDVLSDIGFEDPEIAFAASGGRVSIMNTAFELSDGKLPSIDLLTQLNYCLKHYEVNATKSLVKDMGVPLHYLWRVVSLSLIERDAGQVNRVLSSMKEAGIEPDERWANVFEDLISIRASEMRDKSIKHIVDALCTARKMGYEESLLGWAAEVILCHGGWMDIKGEEIADMIMQSTKKESTEEIGIGPFRFPCGLDQHDALRFWYMLKSVLKGAVGHKAELILFNRLIGIFMRSKEYGVEFDVAERIGEPAAKQMSKNEIPVRAWQKLVPVVRRMEYFGRLSLWRKRGFSWEEYLVFDHAARKAGSILGIITPEQLREAADLREHDVNFLLEMGFKLHEKKRISVDDIASAYEEMKSRSVELHVPHYAGVGEADGLQAYVLVKNYNQYGVMEMAFDVHKGSQGENVSRYRMPAMRFDADVAMTDSTLYVHAIHSDPVYSDPTGADGDLSSASYNMVIQAIEGWARARGFDEVVINIIPGVIDDEFYVNIDAPLSSGYRLVENTDEITEAFQRISLEEGALIYWQKSL